MARPYKLNTKDSFSVIAVHDYYNVCHRDGTIMYSNITSRSHAYNLRGKLIWYFDFFS